MMSFKLSSELGTVRSTGMNATLNPFIVVVVVVVVVVAFIGTRNCSRTGMNVTLNPFIVVVVVYCDDGF